MTCPSKKYCQIPYTFHHVKHATGSLSSVRLQNPRTRLLPQPRSSISQPHLATCYFQSPGTGLVWLPHMPSRMQPSTETPLRKRALVLGWDESVRSLPSNPVKPAVAAGNQHSLGMVTEAVALRIGGRFPTTAVGAGTQYLCSVCGPWQLPGAVRTHSRLTE